MINEVENWYDNEYNEWDRLERHFIEFRITLRWLEQYITKPCAKIFDIGGGPGRYSLYLTQRGHRVTLLDLSQRNIDTALIKCAEEHVSLEKAVKGNALELDEYEENSFDYVLLMGPLYHLLCEEERQRCADNAVRKLKKGGVIFASFISNRAPIQDAFSYLDLADGDSLQSLLGYLYNGENDDQTGFTRAYFSSQSEAEEHMRKAGVKKLNFIGVENLIGCKEREIALLPSEQQELWLELCHSLGEDASLMGTSQHFLYIGMKI